MQKPVAIYTSIAALAAVALGTTFYLKQPAAVIPAKPVETPVGVAPAPKPAETVAVAPATEKAPEVAAAPAAQKPVVIAPEPETQVAVPTPQPEAPAPVIAAEPEAVQPSLPSFDTVRVDTTGDAIIAGRADANASVTVKWNGNVVGTTTANADGSFVLIPEKPLKTGIGAMTIEMSKNGEVTTSEGSVFVVVKKNAPATVAKVEPTAPTDVVQSGAVAEAVKDLQLTSVDYDAAGNIVFAGTAAPGSTVRFYVDNAATGEGIADSFGKWRFSGTSAVTPGTHMLRADAIDKAGKVQRRIELPFLRESPETVAAAQVASTTPAPQPIAAPAAIEPPSAAAESAPAVAPPQPQAVVAATEAPAVVAPLVEEGPRKLVIQPGNSLWKLSREVYGKGRMYTIIYEANKDLVKNPNRIYPGQILTAPKQN